MSFAHPLALAALVIVPLLAWLWLVQDRRRSRAAGAFTNLALLPNLVDRAPGRLRLVPPALFLVALAALLVGFARPHANVRVPRREATVVLAMDVSRSMQVCSRPLWASKPECDAHICLSVGFTPQNFRLSQVSLRVCYFWWSSFRMDEGNPLPGE